MGVALYNCMEAYMKKSAVIILVVALFAGSAFASSPGCTKGSKAGLFSDTAVASDSGSTNKPVKTAK